MAELIIQTEKIKSNIKWLSEYFRQRNIHWSLITKVFSGDKTFLQQVLSDDVVDTLNSVGDSRLSSLRNLKSVKPGIRTIYIKPPAKAYVEEVIRYADISLNSSLSTLEALNEEAGRKGVVHRVILMVEMGELREGINPADVPAFCKQALRLSNIEVIGLGSNLGCMYGIEPTPDKLLDLATLRQAVSSLLGRGIPFLSGGTSITLPLLEKGDVPKEINHFRVGETAFFGTSPLNDQRFKQLSVDTFLFSANIIELEEKKIVPEGVIGQGSVGRAASFSNNNSTATAVKAILDFGLLDVAKEDLEPEDPGLRFVGMTSDMMVLDLGNNETGDGSTRYRIGDQVRFRPNYMAVARLLHSRFIDKVFV